MHKTIRKFTYSMVLLTAGTFLLSGCMNRAMVLDEGQYPVQNLEPISRQVGDVIVSVDPRIELLTSMQLQANYPILTKLDYGYLRASKEYFTPYASEPIIKRFNSMTNKGFSYDAPPTTLLYGSMPDRLTPGLEIPKDLIDRSGGKQALNDFRIDLSNFSRKSDFKTYFHTCSKFYKERVNAVADILNEENYTETLDNFYNMDHGQYHLILSLLDKSGGYGPSITDADGNNNIYGIIGPGRVKNDIPVYEKDFIRYMIWHEFSHSYVNPLTVNHIEEVNALESLMVPIQSKMANLAYPDWEIALNEHIIRAINARFIYHADGQEAAHTELEKNYKNGFIYIQPIYDAISVYESQRDKFTSFDQYYPLILEALEPYLNGKVPDNFSQGIFKGPMNDALSGSTEILYVMPNPSTHEDYKSLHQYVKKIQTRFNPDSKIIFTDNLDPKLLKDRTIVYYGLMTDIQPLLNGKKIPFSIEKDCLKANNSYISDHLQFISCLENPFNSKNGMVIYTAPKIDDILEINRVFHGDEDFVIADKGEVLFSGDYIKKNSQWDFNK